MFRQRRDRDRYGMRRRGATAVELVLVLPLLVTLCLTSVDFGRFAYAYIALENAVRVGAEVGATRAYHESTDANFRQHVTTAVFEDFVAVGGLDPAKLTIDINIDPNNDDDRGLHIVSVSAEYPFQTVIDWPQIPQPLRLKRQIVYRRFR